MLLNCIFLALLFSVCRSLKRKKHSDHFAEELFIRRLASGHLHTQFEFTTQWEVNLFAEPVPNHMNLFPKPMAQIIEAYGVRELHLSLTQGRWHHHKWGYPLKPAPTGIQLWVWFRDDLSKSDVDIRWKGLVNALSGQFCSALISIDPSITTSPKYSFKPQGTWSGDAPNADVHLRHASLSRENVCTENLTPWKKLLPCEGRAGLSTLLKPERLFDSSYHSLAVHMRSVCPNENASCTDSILELKQTLSSVFDPVHANIARSWSLTKLFGTSLAMRCPLAAISSVLVDVAPGVADYRSISPTPDDVREVLSGDDLFRFAVYDLKTASMPGFDVAIQHKKRLVSSRVELPYLVAHKFVTGYGEEGGGIVCTITNNHPNATIPLVYFDVMPYFVRVYLHTLKVLMNGEPYNPSTLHFVPGHARTRPSSLELVAHVPPRTTLEISLEFEKVLLDWTSHPPDAHHGFYLPSSTISALLPDAHNTSGMSETRSHNTQRADGEPRDSDSLMFARLYTSPLLIAVATPDFSMPYNVICLTCTVIAIAFGTIFNLSTRTFYLESGDEVKAGGWKGRLMEEMRRLFKRKGGEVVVVQSGHQAGDGGEHDGDSDGKCDVQDTCDDDKHDSQDVICSADKSDGDDKDTQ